MTVVKPQYGRASLLRDGEIQRRGLLHCFWFLLICLFGILFFVFFVVLVCLFGPAFPLRSGELQGGGSSSSACLYILFVCLFVFILSCSCLSVCLFGSACLLGDGELEGRVRLLWQKWGDRPVKNIVQLETSTFVNLRHLRVAAKWGGGPYFCCIL